MALDKRLYIGHRLAQEKLYQRIRSCQKGSSWKPVHVTYVILFLMLHSYTFMPGSSD